MHRHQYNAIQKHFCCVAYNEMKKCNKNEITSHHTVNDKAFLVVGSREEISFQMSSERSSWVPRLWVHSVASSVHMQQQQSLFTKLAFRSLYKWVSAAGWSQWWQGNDVRTQGPVTTGSWCTYEPLLQTDWLSTKCTWRWHLFKWGMTAMLWLLPVSNLSYDIYWCFQHLNIKTQGLYW